MVAHDAEDVSGWPRRGARRVHYHRGRWDGPGPAPEPPAPPHPPEPPAAPHPPEPPGQPQSAGSAGPD